MCAKEIEFSTADTVISVCDELLRTIGTSLEGNKEVLIKQNGSCINPHESKIAFEIVPTNSGNISGSISGIDTEMRVAVTLQFLIQKELGMGNCTAIAQLYYLMMREVFNGDTETLDRDMMLIDEIIDVKHLSKLFNDNYEMIPYCKER